MFGGGRRGGPPPNTTEYYEFLGVSKDASQEDIRRAYQQKVRLWHPDSNLPPHLPAFMSLLMQNFRKSRSGGEIQAASEGE